MRRALLAATAAMLMSPAIALAGARPSFIPNDPLAPKQYYLAQDHAFDAFDSLPPVTAVKVAVIDSGIDGSHPDLKGKVIAARSFVGGSALTDEEGHGTFVAGEIAASINNEQGIAGIAFPAQLIVAKIARSDASISVRDEAAAIRWAVARGAQVINLSLGGLRNPHNASEDTFSAVERNAVDYAYRHGAVLVAAVGNSDDAPRSPWPWASYPAALPHVIGVSALTQTGGVASFSNRDRVYNDIAAPGQGIFSTLPLAMTKLRPTCVDQGYSDCGPDEFVHAAGTSFAAPQVTAAAAVLLALNPSLRPDQVSNILERNATDMNAADGCGQCPLRRDQYTGWGRLDIARAVTALSGRLPPADRLEPNDDAGSQAAVLPATVHRVTATLDYWDDRVDVYRVHLAAGQRLRATLRGPGLTTRLALWRPGTVRVSGVRNRGLRAAQAVGPGPTHRIAYRVPTSGWYYVEAKVTSPSPGFGSYTLSLSR